MTQPIDRTPGGGGVRWGGAEGLPTSGTEECPTVSQQLQALPNLSRVWNVWGFDFSALLFLGWRLNKRTTPWGTGFQSGTVATFLYKVAKRFICRNKCWGLGLNWEASKNQLVVPKCILTHLFGKRRTLQGGTCVGGIRKIITLIKLWAGSDISPKSRVGEAKYS